MLKEFDVIPINCLWIGPDRLIENIKAINERHEDRFWRYSKQPLDLKNIYFPAPPKGGAHLPKFAIWQPSSMSFGSVLIPNSGDELIQLIRYLNKTFQIRYFSAHLSRDYKNEGICRFEHADEAGQRRAVHVILDRGWEFYEQGVVLPFETPLRYKQPRITDRLNPDVVIQYLKYMGWDLENEAFWESRDDAWVACKVKFK